MLLKLKIQQLQSEITLAGIIYIHIYMYEAGKTDFQLDECKEVIRSHRQWVK